MRVFDAVELGEVEGGDWAFERCVRGEEFVPKSSHPGVRWNGYVPSKLGPGDGYITPRLLVCELFCVLNEDETCGIGGSSGRGRAIKGGEPPQ